jgi:hypothetical protein
MIMKTLIASLIALSTLAAVVPAHAFGPKDLPIPETNGGFGPRDLPEPAGPAFGPKDLAEPAGPAFGPKDLVTSDTAVGS